jgi:hypothetical protein
MKEYIKNFIKGTPIVGPLVVKVKRKLFKKIQERIMPPEPFLTSERYWAQRYKAGGNSGAGSYGKLAEFKAEIINDFVKKHGVRTIIEFGCGDGNQLRIADYPNYIGFDVSKEAIELCNKNFSKDHSKTFKLLNEYDGQTAELTLSLDVIYHLIEDEIFDSYMRRLFLSSERFVIIYSSNTSSNKEGQAAHVKHRKFTTWIEENEPSWELNQYIPNKYPLKNKFPTGSFADFYIFRHNAESCG